MSEGTTTVIEQGPSSMVTAPEVSAPAPPRPAGPFPPDATIRMETIGLSFFYGGNQALHDISLRIPEKSVTAFIGPSGCGKSTYIRCLNRMNDIIPDTRVEGEVLLDGHDIYGPGTDVVDLRRRVGMVFQKSNPVPQVHLRKCGVRPEDQRALPALGAAGARREGPARFGALGRGQGAAATRPRSVSREDSSSASASPGPSPSSRRSS